MQAERKGQVKEELRITSHVLSMMETVIGERESSRKLRYPYNIGEVSSYLFVTQHVAV